MRQHGTIATKEARQRAGSAEEEGWQDSSNVRSAAATAAPRITASDWLFAAALVVAVFLVYQPAWHGGFLWDDDLHLLNNPVLKPGGWINTWVPGRYINYWPLTFTAYWLQFESWGLNPLGFHMVNIALHALSALLVWRILVQLRVPGAMFAAAIFALHPVNVESVAWIAQLKNILSLLLALLSVLFYLIDERRGAGGVSALAIGAFCLSTLAKGMRLTLPVVLLALRLVAAGPHRAARPAASRSLPADRRWRWPAWRCGRSTRWRQADVVRCDSFLSRAAVAGCAVWFYLGKLIWPVDLCSSTRAGTSTTVSAAVVSARAAAGGILALAWRRRHTWGRPVVMLIVCYVGLLAAGAGLREYLLHAILAGGGPLAVCGHDRALRGVRRVAATLARRRRWNGRPAAFAWGCWRSWPADLASKPDVRRRETLFRTTIARNPDCSMAHNNLGFLDRR